MRADSVVPDLTPSRYHAPPRPPIPSFPQPLSTHLKRPRDVAFGNTEALYDGGGSGLVRHKSRLAATEETNDEDGIIQSVERDGLSNEAPRNHVPRAASVDLIETIQSPRLQRDQSVQYIHSRPVNPASGANDLPKLESPQPGQDGPSHHPKTNTSMLEIPESTIATQDDTLGLVGAATQTELRSRIAPDGNGDSGALSELRSPAAGSRQSSASLGSVSRPRSIIGLPQPPHVQQCVLPDVRRHTTAPITPPSDASRIGAQSIQGKLPHPASRLLPNSVQAPNTSKKFMSSSRRDVWETPDSDIDDSQMSPRSKRAEKNHVTSKLQHVKHSRRGDGSSPQARTVKVSQRELYGVLQNGGRVERGKRPRKEIIYDFSEDVPGLTDVEDEVRNNKAEHYGLLDDDTMDSLHLPPEHIQELDDGLDVGNRPNDVAVGHSAGQAEKGCNVFDPRKESPMFRLVADTDTRDLGLEPNLKDLPLKKQRVFAPDHRGIVDQDVNMQDAPIQTGPIPLAFESWPPDRGTAKILEEIEEKELDPIGAAKHQNSMSIFNGIAKDKNLHPLEQERDRERIHAIRHEAKPVKLFLEKSETSDMQLGKKSKRTKEERLDASKTFTPDLGKPQHRDPSQQLFQSDAHAPDKAATPNTMTPVFQPKSTRLLKDDSDGPSAQLFQTLQASTLANDHLQTEALSSMTDPARSRRWKGKFKVGAEERDQTPARERSQQDSSRVNSKTEADRNITVKGLKNDDSQKSFTKAGNLERTTLALSKSNTDNTRRNVCGQSVDQASLAKTVSSEEPEGALGLGITNSPRSNRKWALEATAATPANSFASRISAMKTGRSSSPLSASSITSKQLLKISRSSNHSLSDHISGEDDETLSKQETAQSRAEATNAVHLSSNVALAKSRTATVDPSNQPGSKSAQPELTNENNHEQRRKNNGLAAKANASKKETGRLHHPAQQDESSKRLEALSVVEHQSPPLPSRNVARSHQESTRSPVNRGGFIMPPGYTEEQYLAARAKNMNKTQVAKKKEMATAKLDKASAKKAGKAELTTAVAKTKITGSEGANASEEGAAQHQALQIPTAKSAAALQPHTPAKSTLSLPNPGHGPPSTAAKAVSTMKPKPQDLASLAAARKAAREEAARARVTMAPSTGENIPKSQSDTDSDTETGSDSESDKEKDAKSAQKKLEVVTIPAKPDWSIRDRSVSLEDDDGEDL